jgi:hypothetical protein
MLLHVIVGADESVFEFHGSLYARL